MSSLVDVAFWTFAAAAVVTGYLVFRTDSMVRAAFWLLASFVNVGAILLLLRAEFLGLVLVLMMSCEMTVMAVFMVMFMMNPAGLNPMNMVHQHRAAVAAGVGAFLLLAVTGVVVEFPSARVTGPSEVTAELGEELLGDSMLVFESAGVALLATMIGAIALSSRKGRFGTADEGSEPPPLDEDVASGRSPEDGEQATDGAHGGHG